MKIEKNNAKYIGNKGTIQQDVTYSDPYREVRERLIRRGEKAVVTKVEEKQKK